MTRIVPMLLVLLMAVADPTAQAIAEEAVWPQRVIRVILTAAPGSAGDTVARIVTQRLAERLGQQFVIDNRPAAGGTVACEALAHSEPDGYTIGMVTTSTHGIASIFNPSLPYDPIKDFVPISMLGSSPYVLAVYPGLPAKTVAELVQLAKSKPKQLNNAAFGTTSLGHLAGVLFAHQTGIEINQVSYRSSAQAVVDVVAGRVEMQFSTIPPAIPLIREGKLRALATTGARRLPLLPDIPTLAEAGLDGFDVALWLGIAAPVGTPPAIVAKLNREFTVALSSPDIREALLKQGTVAEPGPPVHLARKIEGDLRKWRNLVTGAGIKTR